MSLADQWMSLPGLIGPHGRGSKSVGSAIIGSAHRDFVIDTAFLLVLLYYGFTVQLKEFPTFGPLVEGILLIVLRKLLPGGIVGGLIALRGRLLESRTRVSRA